jgi:glycosyltransferase involved in cell wall biosynthesis
MITVCIASYNYHRFYPELFASIGKQTNKDFKVILGIDGSRSDMDYVKENPVLAKVVYFPKNKGRYVTSNTLVNMADTSHVLFFDADDIMTPVLIDNVSGALRRNGVVRYSALYKKQDKTTSVCNIAHGSFCINKDLFMSLNGFREWPIAADTEFLKRCNRLKVTEEFINKPLFYYRQHEGSLTKAKDTGFSSPLRRTYANEIKTSSLDKPETLAIHTEFIVV